MAAILGSLSRIESATAICGVRDSLRIAPLTCTHTFNADVYCPLGLEGTNQLVTPRPISQMRVAQDVFANSATFQGIKAEKLLDVDGQILLELDL